VIKDYSLKQSELTAIFNSKQEENYAGQNEEEAEPGLKEGEPSTENLHEEELDRQLNNLTPIVSGLILPQLNKLNDQDVRYRGR